MYKTRPSEEAYESSPLAEQLHLFAQGHAYTGLIEVSTIKPEILAARLKASLPGLERAIEDIEAANMVSPKTWRLSVDI